MVGVAQLVEPRVVIPVVVGSSPIVHPKFSRGGARALLVGENLSLVGYRSVGSTVIALKINARRSGMAYAVCRGRIG